MFLVNSRYPYFRDTYSLLKKIPLRFENLKTISVVIEYALLLPKLQSYFAKFLHLLSSIALVYSTRPPVLILYILLDIIFLRTISSCWLISCSATYYCSSDILQVISNKSSDNKPIKHTTFIFLRGYNSAHGYPLWSNSRTYSDNESDVI